MQQSSQGYDPHAYWTQLHREGTLQSVGQSDLPVELNVWLYRVLERNLLAFLRRHQLLRLPPRRCFEVGVGTGYWIPFWYHLGARRVDGCDLAEDAIARLRQRFPAATFTVGDIVDDGVVPADGSYDLVTVFNVLLHIIDEDSFSSAAGHVAAAVRPGGHLLLVEPALLLDTSVRQLSPGASSMARPLARYREVFEKAGLEFVTASASTTVANNPIEYGLPHIRRFDWSWRIVVSQARKGPRRASVVGRVLSLVDRLVMPSGVAPSGKILLFRRSDVH